MSKSVTDSPAEEELVGLCGRDAVDVVVAGVPPAPLRLAGQRKREVAVVAHVADQQVGLVSDWGLDRLVQSCSCYILNTFFLKG